jgi:hypothetical protein
MGEGRETALTAALGNTSTSSAIASGFLAYPGILIHLHIYIIHY